MHPTVRTARVAGALYLLIVVAGLFGLEYVPGRLIVRGDATATANNIRASELLFRGGIVVNLLSLVVFLLVALALYRLLSGVDRSQAALMVILAALSIPISFLNEVNDIAALILVHGADFLSVFDRRQLDALAMLFLRLNGQGIVVNEIFWGLWLFPFGVLVMRSRFLPRILGLLLIVNGFAWLAVSVTALLLPAYSPLVNRVAVIPETGEVLIMLWLLIRGARVEVPAAASGSLSG